MGANIDDNLNGIYDEEENPGTDEFERSILNHSDLTIAKPVIH